jgi:hypothetical protein
MILLRFKYPTLLRGREKTHLLMISVNWLDLSEGAQWIGVRSISFAG